MKQRQEQTVECQAKFDGTWQKIEFLRKLRIVFWQRVPKMNFGKEYQNDVYLLKVKLSGWDKLP